MINNYNKITIIYTVDVLLQLLFIMFWVGQSLHSEKIAQ